MGFHRFVPRKLSFVFFCSSGNPLEINMIKKEKKCVKAKTLEKLIRFLLKTHEIWDSIIFSVKGLDGLRTGTFLKLKKNYKYHKLP